MLHPLSGIPAQLQLVPPSPFFPHSHGLSDSDMEGVAVLKVGPSTHLTSFPNTLLCLSLKSLLIGVHLKRGLWEDRVGREGVASVQSEKEDLWSTTPDCSQL